MRKTLVSLIILLSFPSCMPLVTRRNLGFHKEPTIRILIIKDPTRITISSDVGTKIVIGKKEGVFAGELRVTFNPLKIWIAKNKIIKEKGFPIDLFPLERGYIYLNSSPYRGFIKIVRYKGDILIVNYLPIEEYLKGVVPFEMGRLPERMIEALKAQAVASRSYALRSMKRNMPYDLGNTIAHQVYGGMRKETDVTNRAVEETKGVVPTYRGRPIDARYSSTCGGRTENNEEVWNSKPVPYLRSVYDGRFGKPFCRFSPHFNWRVVFGRKEFFDTVKMRIKEIFGKEVNRINYVKISRRTRSGRVRTVEVRTDRGKFKVERDRIRSLFPKNGISLKSLLFSMEVRGDKIVVSGHGYGHGVGMCQYGAMEMARDGYTYDKIIRHYYRGVSLKRLW